MQAVVEVIAPVRIQAEPALLRRQHHARVVEITFRDEVKPAVQAVAEAFGGAAQLG